jgi:hypothetical protein
MLPKRGPVFLNKYYGYKKLLKQDGHSRRMTLDEDFCDFIESPVMIIIGTRSACPRSRAASASRSIARRAASAC